MPHPTLNYNYFNTDVEQTYLSSPYTIHFGNDSLLCTCMSLQHRHYRLAQDFYNTAKLPHTLLQTPLPLYRQRNKFKLREYYSTWNYAAVRLVNSSLYPFFLIKCLITWICFQTNLKKERCLQLVHRDYSPGQCINYVSVSHYLRSQNCEKRILAASCPSVCPSVRTEELGYHWSDFLEIWYLSIFRKLLEKIRVSLKSDNNNMYFTWRPINIFDHMSLISS